MREALIWRFNLASRNPGPSWATEGYCTGFYSELIWHVKGLELVAWGPGGADGDPLKHLHVPFNTGHANVFVHEEGFTRLISEGEAQKIYDFMTAWCAERHLEFSGQFFPLTLEEFTQETGKSPEAASLFGVPSIFTQALIVPQRKSQAGVLVESICFPWLELVRLLKEDPSLAFRIDPFKWEEIIAGAYKKAGFDEVLVTNRSGDFGRDVIAVKHGVGCVRFIDSVKRYAPGHPVPADDVRALLGVLQSDRSATKGVLTTTSTFAPRIADDPFIKPFIPFRLELVDGSELMRRLGELARKK